MNDDTRQRAVQLSYATRDALFRAIYLTDILEREGLSWIGVDALERARAEVMEACGLNPTKA